MGSTTKYFVLGVDRIIRLHSVLDIDGNPITKHYREGLSFSGKYHCEIAIGVWGNQDLLYTVSGELLVSKVVFDLIKEMCIPDYLKFARVSVLDKSSNAIAQRFLVHRFLQYEDVIDLEKSDLIYSGKVLTDFKRMVFKREAAPDYDFFPVIPRRYWVISEPCAAKMESLHLEGFTVGPQVGT